MSPRRDTFKPVTRDPYILELVVILLVLFVGYVIVGVALADFVRNGGVL